MDVGPGPNLFISLVIIFLIVINIFMVKSEIKLLKSKTSIDSKDKNYENIIDFNSKKVEKIMTPRTEVYCINIDDPLEEFIDELLNKRYTRIPVYENDIDNIIGVLYMKDFIIEARKKGFENINLKDILIKPNFVPECKKIKDLFIEMKFSESKMAIVIDEYGGFSGIATVEDLVEEVMGDINDDHEHQEKEIVEIANKALLVDGTASLEDLEEILNVDFKVKDIDTISGFLINEIGKIPGEHENKQIEFDGINFKVYKVSDKKIEKVIINY